MERINPSIETLEKGRGLIEASPQALTVYHNMKISVSLEFDNLERLRTLGRKKQLIREDIYKYKQTLWNYFGNVILGICGYKAPCFACIDSRIKSVIESLEGEFLC